MICVFCLDDHYNTLYSCSYFKLSLSLSLSFLSQIAWVMMTKGHVSMLPSHLNVQIYVRMVALLLADNQQEWSAHTPTCTYTFTVAIIKLLNSHLFITLNVRQNLFIPYLSRKA